MPLKAWKIEAVHPYKPGGHAAVYKDQTGSFLKKLPVWFDRHVSVKEEAVKADGLSWERRTSSPRSV